MGTKVLQPADRMTTAQCVIECSGYLRTIANQEYEGEDWQTAPKYRRRNLLTDFLACIELTGEEFAELCGFIGFQLSKTTTAKLAKFTVIAYDWQGEANGEATADILAALDKCEGVTLIEQRGYRPQARTYDYLRFHIAAFWRCLVNELRSLCLNVGLVVYPKEIPATPTETPRISTETAETVNVSAKSEKEAERAKYRVSRIGGYKIIVGDRVQGKVIAVLMSVNGHNTIEINDETAHVAIMGEKPLQIDKPIMQLSDAEVLELIYKPTQPQDEPREAENKPTVAEVVQMVKTELAKNKAMHTVWHLEFPDGTECDMRYKLTAAGCDFYEYTESRDGA